MFSLSATTIAFFRRIRNAVSLKRRAMPLRRRLFPRLKLELLEDRAVPSATIVDTINFSPSRAGAIATNAVTNRVYAAAEDVPAIRVIDSATDTVITQVPTQGYHSGVAVNQATNRVYVSQAFAGSVCVIDGATNTVLTDLSVGGVLGDLAVNPATNRLYVIQENNNDVAVFDTTNGAFLTSVAFPSPYGQDSVDLAVDASTNRIYIANNHSNKVTVIDGASNTVLATIPVGNNPEGIGVDARTHHVYVTNTGANTVSVIDGAPSSPTVNTVLATITVGSTPDGVDVNPLTGRVYVGNNPDHTVSIIDDSTNTVVETVPMPAGAITLGELAVVPGTNRIYVASGDVYYVIEDDFHPDTTPPVTKVSLSGPARTDGWYTGRVTVTLTATDDDSGVARTQYTIDGGATQTYAGPFTVSGDASHTITYFSTDNAGNTEDTQTVTVNIDATPPTLTLATSTASLWPANGKMVSVTVSGKISDNLSGVDPTQATYAVIDEYEEVQPAGSISVNPDGTFSFQISLEARRRGQDKDGRLYRIMVTTTDLAGNLVTETTSVVVPHDQRK